MDQLEATVGKLDSVAGNANAMIAENRPALQSFANEGLSQMGPTLAELRALIRDLRRVTDRLDGGPARYILGRDAPKEFEPK
jgi:phospholipid/cholesterol/gamma-HCH transport system substrate-binding protein